MVRAPKSQDQRKKNRDEDGGTSNAVPSTTISPRPTERPPVPSEISNNELMSSSNASMLPGNRHSTGLSKATSRRRSRGVDDDDDGAMQPVAVGLTVESGKPNEKPSKLRVAEGLPVYRRHDNSIPVTTPGAMAGTTSISSWEALFREEDDTDLESGTQADTNTEHSPPFMQQPGAFHIPPAPDINIATISQELQGPAPEPPSTPDPEILLSAERVDSPPTAEVVGELEEQPKCACFIYELSPRSVIYATIALLVIIGGAVAAVVLLTGSKGGTVPAVAPPSLAPSRAPTQPPTPAPLRAGMWTQMGQTLVGEVKGNAFGSSIALSANGTIVAVGQSSIEDFSTGDGLHRGEVRVFTWIDSGWSRLGTDINGEDFGDFFGRAVALSADGTMLAVGADENNGNGAAAGHVRVYRFMNEDWSQVGSDLDGSNPVDLFGSSVSLSSDGSVLAVGAQAGDGDGNVTVNDNRGQAYVFRLVNEEWVQIGANINGDNVDDRLGDSIALSADGTMLAVGAPHSFQSEYGYVRTFRIVDDNWFQIGSHLIGQNLRDKFGSSVALSADGSILAVGSEDGAGYVRTFRLENGNWTQLAADVNGKGSADGFGNSLALSADGDILAAGSLLNDDNGENAGHVRIYQLVDNAWEQIESTIRGQEARDYFGSAVALSADGRTVAGGAIQWNKGGIPGEPGYAQVYYRREDEG